MEAEQIIRDTAFDPEKLRMVFAAFDMAWAEMQRDYPLPVSQRAGSRKRLATMMLSFVTESTRDPVALKDETLQALRLK